MDWERFDLAQLSATDQDRNLIYTRRACVFDVQGAWIWRQDKVELRRHITLMSSTSNAVMRPEMRDLEAESQVHRVYHYQTEEISP